jgi:hypothetical protein
MDNNAVQTTRPRGLWLLTIAIALFVPLPWYICLFGCDWVLKPLISSFAWFRLILLSPWVTPLAFILPLVYLFGINYLLNRYWQTLTKKRLLLVGVGIAALYLISYFINR